MERWRLLIDHFERRAKFLLYPPRNGYDQVDISVAAIDDVDVPSGFGALGLGGRYRDLFHRSTFRMLANCGENLGTQFLTRNGLAHRRYSAFRCPEQAAPALAEFQPGTKEPGTTLTTPSRSAAADPTP